MLQQDQPDDYVIATGEQYSVRDFVRQCASVLGLKLAFCGQGLDEVATIVAVDTTRTPDLQPGTVIVRVDPRYFRPAEVDALLGDASKAKAMLGWQPSVDFAALCQEMMLHDLQQAEKSRLLAQHGFGEHPYA